MIPVRKSESGFALLAVMLGLAVISVLAFGLVLVTRSGVRESHFDLIASQERAFGDAVVLRVSLALSEPNGVEHLRVDGIPQKITVLGHVVTASIASEFGKIDFNVADQVALTRLFEAAGQGPDASAEIATNVVNWRSQSDGNSGIRVFRAVSEIAQVPGLTDEICTLIAGAVTVYSGRDTIDQNTAPLLALESIPGIDHLQAQAIIRDRVNGVQSVQTGEIIDGRLAPGISIAGWAFSINAEFSLDTRPEMINAVIRMTGDPAKPYLILWQSQIPD